MLYEYSIQLTLALVVGSLIGLEREINGKVAGFRTMALICVGSTILTIISIQIGGETSKDRIAANILTGIGFIGAGVIFKEGISVNGLTTAALIWVTAALGMAIGYKNYPLAIVVTAVVVVALFVLEPVQRFINRFHRVKDYKIRTVEIGNDFKLDLETFFSSKDLTFRCMKILKDNFDAVYTYRISSPDRNYDLVNHFLLEHPGVKSFDV